MGLYDRDYMRLEWASRSCEIARSSNPPTPATTPRSPNLSKFESDKPQSDKPQSAEPQQFEATSETSRSKTELSLNAILLKIQERGIDSLTHLEREWLIATSADHQRRKVAKSE